MFQHTAARRRLAPRMPLLRKENDVSTHSRPKAAGTYYSNIHTWTLFQHTAARRRLG